MSKGLRVFWFQLKQELGQVRVWILCLILAVFIYSCLEPVADLARAVGEKVSPWAFPHLVNDYICQMVFMVGAVFLFSTAPFEGKAHYYIIQRSGSFSWRLGNVLYILASSFLFVGFIGALSVISLLSCTRFSGDWGIIWGTLARTNAGSQYGVPFTVFAYIIGVFSPVEATVISFLLEWACVAWMGLVVYLFNFITEKMTGILVAALFVFLDVMIYNSWTPKAYRFSPVTLAQLKALSGNNLSYGVSLEYAEVFFAVTITLFIAVICLAKRGRVRCALLRGKGTIGNGITNVICRNRKEMGAEKMNHRKIILKNVSKTIGDQTVLKNISLEIPERGIYGIVGRNGSGKTVLIKCLCGFMPVTEGEIWIGEKQVGRDVEFTEDIGFIIETPGFLPRESGFRNLKFIASIRNVVGKERIRECITMVGLDPDDKKVVAKYSLGMRQRLGIAQAIMEDPSLIILDEPMNGLDNHGVEEIRKLLLGLKEEGKLILIVSHNREDIDLLCDRVYEMDRGVLTQVKCADESKSEDAG